MLTILMNYIFVFSIGILIGLLFAFEVFQNQLEQILSKGKYHITNYGWIK